MTRTDDTPTPELILPEPMLPEPAAAEMEWHGGVAAMDFATIGLALRRLSEYLETPLERLKPAPAAAALIERLSAYSHSDYRIHDVDADIQPESGRHLLNALAEAHNFPAPYQNPFAGDAYGLVSIVDKSMRWHRGDATESTLWNCVTRDDYEAVAFSVHSGNEDRFLVRWHPGKRPLVRVTADPARSGGVVNHMWVTELTEPPETYNDLFATVAELTDSVGAPGPQRGLSQQVAGVTIPKLLDVSYSRTLAELVGTSLSAALIMNAGQQLRVGVDEIGAEAAAMTTMMPVWCSADLDMGPSPTWITLGDSGWLLVWFTEADSLLPICATVADPDAYTPAVVDRGGVHL